MQWSSDRPLNFLAYCFDHFRYYYHFIDNVWLYFREFLEILFWKFWNSEFMEFTSIAKAFDFWKFNKYAKDCKKVKTLTLPKMFNLIWSSIAPWRTNITQRRAISIVTLGKNDFISRASITYILRFIYWLWLSKLDKLQCTQCIQLFFLCL